MKAEFGTWKIHGKKNNSARDNSRLTFLEGHLYNKQHLKVLIGINTSSYDFTSLTPQEKTDYLQRLTLYLHKGVKPTNSYNLSVFFYHNRFASNNSYLYFESK